MAKRFLTHIDLAGNQLLNASFEKLSADPSTGLFEGRMYYNTTSDAIKIYDGTAWIGLGEIVSISGTTDEVDVSVTDGVATISLPSNIHVNVTGDLTGNADTATNADYATSAGNATTADSATNADYATSAGNATTADSATYATSAGSATTATSADTASIAYSVEPDSVALGIGTYGDYVQMLMAGNGISVDVTTGEGQMPVVENTGVLSVTGTANQIDADVSTGDVTVSFSDTVIFPGTVTLNADPTQALEAATKQYVDGMAAGLDWHSAVNLLAASNVALTGSSGTLVIDGHAALDDNDDGYRILLKGQTTDSEEGIYVYSDNGTSYTLSRAADADAFAELVGAAVFVMEGTTYGATAWIQSNHYLTDFTGQTWIQFSGTGTYTAGNGITLTGTSFSIDTSVTVDVSTSQTLTNKTLTSPVVSGLYLSDNNIIIEGTTDTHETTLTFTDPTADRTITFKDDTGTVAFTSDIPSSTTGLSEGTNLYFTDERAQDAVGDAISGSNSLSATYNDGAGTFAFDTTLASTSYMSKASGLAVDISALETKLTTDGYTKKASGSVGNGTNTSFALSHGLGTRDVQVQVFDNATYDTVECDVVRTDTNTVTVSFATAPTTNAYRVVVIG
jgi:hypothetical protein